MRKKLLLHRAGDGWAASLLFEPRDLWVGAFWDRYREGPCVSTDVYVCLVPTLPVRVTLSSWSVR